MSETRPRAYSRKQWFFAVNLIALLGASGFILPAFLSSVAAALSLLPAVLVVALLISWIFLAAPLAYAMRKPASWLRAALWGGGTAAGLALLGFVIAQMRRWRAQADPSYNYRLGGGDYVRDIDGVLTPYGWWVVVENNTLFVLYGLGIALIVRAILGPGGSVE